VVVVVVVVVVAWPAQVDILVSYCCSSEPHIQI
jgi:hypothetical protein